MPPLSPLFRGSKSSAPFTVSLSQPASLPSPTQGPVLSSLLLVSLLSVISVTASAPSVGAFQPLTGLTTLKFPQGALGSEILQEPRKKTELSVFRNVTSWNRRSMQGQGTGQKNESEGLRKHELLLKWNMQAGGREERRALGPFLSPNRQ